MIHVRLIGEEDVPQVVDLIYEIRSQARYAAQAGPLNEYRMSNIVLRSITQPEEAPCFVHDVDGGRLGGLLFGFVVPTFFNDERWFEERAFYVRREYRSLAVARAYVRTLEEWCREQGIRCIELGNAFTMDPRMLQLYKRMGYEQVNTTHARRL